MALVLTNGEYYIKTSATGGIQKTANIEEAQRFYSREVAMKKVLKAPSLCRNYIPVDTEDITCIAVGEAVRSKKRRRKKYSATQRKIIYCRSDGRCSICGKHVKFQDFSVDHVIPLSKGGSNDMSNLAAAHRSCNLIKQDCLPQELKEKVTEIFLYQITKKLGAGEQLSDD